MLKLKKVFENENGTLYEILGVIEYGQQNGNCISGGNKYSNTRMIDGITVNWYINWEYYDERNVVAIIPSGVNSYPEEDAEMDIFYNNENDELYGIPQHLWVNSDGIPLFERANEIE